MTSTSSGRTPRFGDGTYLDVVMSKSSDGGRNWSTPKVVDTAPAGTSAFNGTVEVTADGTVSVLWYDFRGNDASPGLPTSVFLRHSHDGGATAGEQKLAGPFDMEAAPSRPGEASSSATTRDWPLRARTSSPSSRPPTATRQTYSVRLTAL